MAAKIDVVVPVLNEVEALEGFHARMRQLPLDLHLIFVDNGSTDGSQERIRRFGDATLVEHESDEGYGASIIDGLGRSSADVVAIIDADCEYPPEALPRLVDALDQHPVVYGSRFLDDAGGRLPAPKRLGNRLITAAFNLLFRQSLTDLYTGCKVLRRSALHGIALERPGFEHVLELGVRLAQRAVPIGEVGVRFEPRSTGRSKMRHASETLKFFGLLLRYAAERPS